MLLLWKMRCMITAIKVSASPYFPIHSLQHHIPSRAPWRPRLLRRSTWCVWEKRRGEIVKWVPEVRQPSGRQSRARRRVSLQQRYLETRIEQRSAHILTQLASGIALVSHLHDLFKRTLVLRLALVTTTP